MKNEDMFRLKSGLSLDLDVDFGLKPDLDFSLSEKDLSLSER